MDACDYVERQCLTLLIGVEFSFDRHAVFVQAKSAYAALSGDGDDGARTAFDIVGILRDQGVVAVADRELTAAGTSARIEKIVVRLAVFGDLGERVEQRYHRRRFGADALHAKRSQALACVRFVKYFGFAVDVDDHRDRIARQIVGAELVVLPYVQQRLRVAQHHRDRAGKVWQSLGVIFLELRVGKGGAHQTFDQVGDVFVIYANGYRHKFEKIAALNAGRDVNLRRCRGLRPLLRPRRCPRRCRCHSRSRPLCRR